MLIEGAKARDALLPYYIRIVVDIYLGWLPVAVRVYKYKPVEERGDDQGENKASKRG